MKRFVCKAILFDLDGVLIDSGAAVEHHWRQWAEKHGLDVAKIFAIMHGRRTAETIREIAPHLPAESEALALEMVSIEDLTDIVALPGAKEALAALPTNRWAIVTSGTRLLALPRIEHAGLPLPDVFISGEKVEHGKPHPEGYLAAAAQLGFAPEDCVVIEDAPAGIQAGRAAGMQVIAVTTTYPADMLQHATYRVPSLAALTITSTDDAVEITVSEQ